MHFEKGLRRYWLRFVGCNSLKKMRTEEQKKDICEVLDKLKEACPNGYNYEKKHVVEIIDQFKRNNDLLPKELENGKVYKKKHTEIIVYKTGKSSGFGIGVIGFQNKSDWSFDSSPENWQPATNEEWLSALSKYADSQGYLDGGYECLRVPNCTAKGKFIKYTFDYRGLWIFLSGGQNLIMNTKGEWAKIKRDELVSVEDFQPTMELKNKNIEVDLGNGTSRTEKVLFQKWIGSEGTDEWRIVPTDESTN